jgi:hypothetical protein
MNVRNKIITTNWHRTESRRLAALFAANDEANGGHGRRNHIASIISYEETLRRGLLGEFAFGAQFRLPINSNILPHGDGGLDFRVPLLVGGEVRKYPVNIKTKSVQVNFAALVRSGTHLRVSVSKVLPEVIYVFAIYREPDDTAEALRWEWGRTLIDLNERMNFENGNGEESYVRRFEDLRGVTELWKRLALERV